LQKFLDWLGEWAVENAMKIYPSKSKAFRFTRVRVKDTLGYSLTDTLIPEASSCTYLGIILRGELCCADQVNNTVKKGLEGTTFHNANTQKGKQEYQMFILYFTITSDS
jgi:hypothetical protein